MTNDDLVQQKIDLLKFIERSEEQIQELTKGIYWKRKHVRLLEKQIEEATKESSSETLQELNGKVQ